MLRLTYPSVSNRVSNYPLPSWVVVSVMPIEYPIPVRLTDSLVERISASSMVDGLTSQSQSIQLYSKCLSLPEVRADPSRTCLVATSKSSSERI
jgi:hypothetical protein